MPRRRGLNRRDLKRQRVGVFVGAEPGDYQDLRRVSPLTANHDSLMAARLAYHLDLDGPVMTINTSCSSGLVALHQAWTSLQSGACDVAFVGAANLILDPGLLVRLGQAGMVSSTGECRPFDRRANGLVPGEAVVALVLKRTATARLSGDVLEAVIDGCGINYDGFSMGITAPNGAAQARLIGAVHDRTGIDPRTIRHFIAHGTGTSLGDPIESQALAEVFGRAGVPRGHCALTSVKGHVGHSFAASGLVNVAALVESMRTGVIPAAPDDLEPSPHMNWAEAPFYLPKGNTAWDASPDGLRRGATSAFGMSGTNAHVVLSRKDTGPDTGPAVPLGETLFVLSARNDAALRRRVADICAWLDGQPENAALPARLAHVLTARRFHFEHRVAVIASGREDLLALWRRFLDRVPDDCVLHGSVTPDQLKQRATAEAEAGTVLRAADAPLADLARAYCAGHEITLDLDRNGPIAALSLPDYPFQLKDCWIPERDLHSAVRRAESSSSAVARPASSMALSGSGKVRLTLLDQVPSGPASPGLSGSVLGAGAESDTDGGARPPRPLPPFLEGEPTAPSNEPRTGRSGVDHGRVRARLRASLADMLLLEPDAVDPARGFTEQALDSILGVEWVRELNRVFGLRMKTSVLYDHPCVDALADHIAGLFDRAADVGPPGPTAVPGAEARTVEAPKLPQASSVDSVVRAVVAEVLLLDADDIDPERDFVSLGLDSIIGVDLVRLLNTRLDLSMRTSVLYDRPTLLALSGHVRALVGGQNTAAVAPAQPLRMDNARRVVQEPVEPAPTQPHRTAEPRPRPTTPEPIAIIGAAGCYPGIDTLDQYWEVLVEGRDMVREVPAWRGFAAVPEIYCRWMGSLDDVDCFDPLFFNISPRDAERMDPQHRLFLEEAYRTVEDAGYDAGSLGNARCGVFLGIMGNEYASMQRETGGGSDAAEMLGGSHAVAAARIAFHLNLKGPALAIDTACSSSLVAVHLACQAIRNGDCDLALAGGVSTYLLPDSYVGMCDAGMLSPRGRCHAFDDGADGFVPGEGVGCVLLKSLSQALKDGDRIDGVILGSGINQDGRTNGITAPSRLSQTALLTEVYARNGIDPGTIQYAEMHGTGTPLGDPIELEALAEAFNDGPSVLRIGSVKSNLGHCSAAAGVAGLHKLLLMLRHRAFVPTIHVQTPTQRFAFDESPLSLGTDNRPWPQPGDGGARRACLSSFGYSGTNAHLVLAEWRESAARPELGPLGLPLVLPFSARTEPQLIALAASMARHFEDHPDVSPEAVADTLRRGRKPMRERLAVVATDLAQAAELLRAVARGLPFPPGTFRGSAPVAQDAAPDPRPFTSFGTPAELAAAWVTGGAVDWTPRIAGVAQPVARVRLPGYPFERRRCWLEPGGPSVRRAVVEALPGIITRTYGFDATHRLIREHVVNGLPLLPGTAVIDLVLDAAMRALPDGKGVCLTGGTWLRPIAPTDAGVHLVLTGTRGEGTLSLMLRSLVGADPHPSEHFTCTLDPDHSSGAPSNIDIVALCAAWTPDPAAVEDLLSRQVRAGIAYGPSYRCLDTVYRDGDDAVLVRLDAPCSGALDDGLVLNPALLDAAMQAAGLVMAATDDTVRVPFAFRTLRLAGPRNGRGGAPRWVSVRRSDRDNARGPQVTVQVTLYDAAGTWLLDIADLTLRAIAGSPVLIERLEPRWLPLDPMAGAQLPVDADHVIWLLGFTGHTEVRQALDGLRLGTGPMVESVGQAGDTPEQILADLHGRVKAFVQRQHAAPAIVQLVVIDDDRCLSAASALLRAVGAECIRLRGRTIMVPPSASVARIAEAVAMPVGEGIDHVFVDASDVRHRVWMPQDADEAALPLTAAAPPWRADGVYLVTGGSGGIGREIAVWLASHVPKARLVLCGRRAEHELAWLADLPGRDRVSYHRIDITDRRSVEDLGRIIAALHGRLNGVIHAAGLVTDRRIGEKSTEEVLSVLAPKTVGLRLLDAMSATFELDFFAAFSSVSAALGVVGQTDYAMANAYMDDFILWRQRAVQRGARTGQSLSINWPIWQSGGMRVESDHLAMLERTQGIVALTTGQAMQAFAAALRGAAATVMILASDGRTIAHPAIRRDAARPVSGHPIEAGPIAVADQPATVDAGRIERIIIEAAAAQLGVNSRDIDVDANLGDYGFDSISFTKLGAALNAQLGLDLTPPIFFEYLTVARLAGHIAGLGRVSLPPVSTRAPTPVPRSVPLAEAAGLAAQAVQPPFDRPAPASAAALRASARSDSDGVAIIGISAAFPLAQDIAAFWENLALDRLCIGDLPAHRRYDWILPNGATCPTRAGFMEGIDQFDPLFFRLSPKEAALMDPHQRLLLMHAWRAVEDAGYAAADLRGTDTAVYFGTAGSGYAELLQSRGARVESHTATGNVASVAPNRVSYLFDLHGPSEPVETACSSALVAVHKACDAIRLGRSRMAIAGAVNVLATATSHLSFHKAGMLSPDAACKTFSADANGYVRGEGVGVLLLKSLKACEEDGDAIYGVIRGSAVNHGGHAASFTSPNPNAQAALVADAIRQSGIDPASISYIECHGTGTPLGDPIEVEGLLSAFAQVQNAEGSGTEAACALGSVKSNIGHLELAAGIAGIVKVLMQIKHRTLAGSLNSLPVNPYLRLEGTRFSIVHQKQPWTGRRLADGTTDALVAGVSSFGFGGTNAHVILSEHIGHGGTGTTPATQRPDPSVPLPFVLSAAEEPVLREQARALAARLKADPLDLLDVSCTLCSGRTPMRARLGLVASTLAELVEVLETCADSGDLAKIAQQGRVWLGAGTTHPAGLAGLDKDAAFSTLARQWLLDGEAARLVEMWCHGAEVPWRAVFAADKPRRVHLPTYPFQLQRYWYEESGQPVCGLAGTAPETMLPRQVTVPAMLADQHRIDGRRVMPGATYLALLLRERARLGATGYSDMRWPQWLEVADGADPVVLAIRHDAAQGALAFALAEGDPEQAICRARIVTDVAQELPRMALDPMQADPDASELDAETLYRHYAEAGLDYGETFRVLDRMWISEDRVLARLRTPVRPVDCPLETMTALLDAMFHATGAWHIRDSGADRLFGLPTSIERITVADESLLAEWVVVERLGSLADTLRSTLLLCDASGSVILRVENVLAVPATTAPPAADDADALAESAVCSVLTPIWQASVPHRTAWSGSGTVRVVGATGALRENLVQSCPDARFAGWDETDSGFPAIPECGSAPEPLTMVLVCDGAMARTDGAVRAILSLVKTLGARGWRDRPVTLKALTVCGKSVNGERPDPAQAAVQGFLGALARERPLWRVDILDFATEADRSAGVTRTLDIGSGLSGAVLAQRAGRWYMQRLSEAASGDAQGQPTRLGFRQRGIYLVLGGGGGLGVALSEWLIRQVQARILWVGSRPAAAVAAARDAIHAATGSRPDYIQADARSLSDMEQVRAHILADHGRLDGIFVATMRLHDKAVDQLEEQELLDALGAKIDVCQTALDAFAPAASDFIVHFGSTQSFSTEAGQSAYAAASQGADAVMSAHAATAGGAGVRVGTVHWGFWGHHGAVATPRHRELMRRRGVASLQPDPAFAAMHDMLTRHATDFAVIRATAPLSGVLGDAFAAKTTTMALSDAVAESTACLDRNLAEAMTAILFGVLDTLPDRVAATDFADRVHPRHARWVGGTLRFASEFGLLAPVFRSGPDQGPTFEPTEALRHLLADRAWVERWTDFAETHGQDPHVGPQVRLAAACIAQLRGMLRGEVLPVQVLFPDSRASLTADVYESGTVARHINHRVAKVVAQAVEQAGRTGKRLRILEVGAGSGATTRAVLGALDGSMACVAEYCFSDISPTLLEAARRMFRDGPSCLGYRHLDLEDPEGQHGPDQAGYDVVVAANVLHATADIVQVLARLKTALAPGGVLVLAEISDASPFTHTTFGLLDGWWRFEDERRIPGCPGLYPAAWRRALEDAGFAGVTFPAAADHILGQQVILARAEAHARPALLFRNMPAATPSAAPDLLAVPGPQSGMLSDEASDTATLVRDTIAAAIGLSATQIHLGMPLKRYGVDSLLHSEILARLRPLVRTLPDTVLFEYPSVQELADYIDGQGLRIAPPIPAPALVTDRPEMADMPPVWPHAARVEASGVATGPPVAEQPEQAVAIIGMAGRFPGCDDIDALWAALSEGRNCIGAQPADRRTGQGSRGKWGGFLNAPERFDFETFGLKWDDLEGVTPELGLLLETSWHAFEDAGYGKCLLGRQAARKDGGIGVFVGSMYDQSGFVGGELGKARQASNTTGWNLANRLSHMFDLQGPSIFVNTACSGAVSAIHLACQSIRSGQCPSTLVAGVNLTLDSSKYDVLDAAGFLGTGPLSCSFGTGDGFIPSEAVAAVYLKRLDLALRDGDLVRAVISADGVAHSGGRQSYTAPDPQTEARLITRVLAQGRVDPADIGYVECSANGSPLGDAVEITAIKTALAVFGSDSPCALGTVKSNLGHMEAASGIVQLIKVVLMMERCHLVASINCEPANPLIRLDGTRFAVQKQPGPWPEPRSGTGPRHALVTAFGAGGSYGCLLVRSVAQGRQPMQATSVAEPPPNRLPILLSARSETALRRRAVDIRAALHDRQIGLGDLSESLFRLDHDLPVRWAALPASIEDLLVMLDRVASGHENLSDCGDGADLRRWVGGEEVSLTTLFASPKGRFIRLPAYPFERPSPTDIALPPDRDATLAMSDSFDQLIAAVKAGLVSEHEFARSVGEMKNA
jgi:rhizoxin biosynthesis, polyketide synthase RhiD